MDTTTTLTSDAAPAAETPRAPWLRHAWLIAGGAVLTTAGLAAGFAWRPAPPAEPVPTASPEPAKKTPVRTAAAVSGREATQQQASVCATCGVVEGVREVKVKGEATGLGAVAGGVLGAAVGNQAGKGNGRKAMTVVGAVGGGLAGHEIEKRARAETHYDVTIRMDDGSVRTLRQKTAPAKGARVTVDGKTLRTAA
jgi:outer membrane lipoprotein SlyB